MSGEIPTEAAPLPLLPLPSRAETSYNFNEQVNAVDTAQLLAVLLIVLFPFLASFAFVTLSPSLDLVFTPARE
jgi:hypothetical protein